MAGGRPRKSAALKILTGNPGKRAAGGPGPRPDATPPKCPAWLSAAAKKVWKATQPELTRLGLLSCVDGPALAAYCQAAAELELATRALEEEGRFITVGGEWVTPPAQEEDGAEGQPEPVLVGGQRQPHPAVAQQRSAWKAVREFSSLFGLDPSARVRLKDVAPPEQEDELESFARARAQ